MANLILTIGNTMMGDDAAGALLAEKLRAGPVEGWDVLHGGAMPENAVHRIRDMAPHKVLVVDATEMDLEPGAVRRIPPERIADPLFLTTHALPLTFLIEALQEFTQVEMLGIQPEIVAFGLPVSRKVQDAVDMIYTRLKAGQLDFPDLPDSV